ncbi:MAG: NADPH-dependent F420 reductase [Myxococcaceae bacterium]|jgi:predicted dinucleotide-binding enzyme|nr:NADPH-dependent F420 reductase [Myxococcaceae bacterium]MCA3016395.1 NADPH-dependent F420 reductase [Myxococcaceae bacterium]
MRIGIIGSGMMGSTLGTLWAKAGHEVRFSSRHPEQLDALVQRVGPSASRGSIDETAAWADVAFLGVPLSAMPELSKALAGPLAGKVVLDANNLIPARDGALVDEVKQLGHGTGGWTQAKLPRSSVVKAFNTVHFRNLADAAHRAEGRMGIPLAGNDARAMKKAEGLVLDAGFEPLFVGDIAASARFDFGTPVWNSNMTGAQVRHALGL